MSYSGVSTYRALPWIDLLLRKDLAVSVKVSKPKAIKRISVVLRPAANSKSKKSASTRQK